MVLTLIGPCSSTCCEFNALYSQGPSATPHSQFVGFNYWEGITIAQHNLNAHFHLRLPTCQCQFTHSTLDDHKGACAGLCHQSTISRIRPSLNDPVHVNKYMEQLQVTLHCKNLCSLRYVCKSLDCTPSKETRLYKANYINALVKWVSSSILMRTCHWCMYIQQCQMPLSVPLSDVHHMLDWDTTLTKICNIIHNMLTPLWFGSIPANFGNASAGTIKADEWRLLIMAYIPLALISL